jgi:DHA1 family bicyclomycin/chloramphenicol resistance-like MFS transporter
MPDSRGRRVTLLVILALAATLSPVSIDILTPSLAGLARDLNTGAQTIERTIYAFLVGYGLAPLFWGKLSDHHGRRPVMIAGMLIYCVSSLLCSKTTDPQTLIMLRFIQGVGGGAGATMARAVIRDIYGSGGTTRGMARMMSLMAVVPFLIPLLGGYIASTLSWQACFLAMTVIAAISVAAYFFMVPETRPPAAPQTPRPATDMLGILRHPVFLQHAICNMFSITILVLFGANFAFICNARFQFEPAQNGLVLSLLNGSIALGTYVVFLVMPHLGAHRSILLGSLLCAGSWLAVALLNHWTHATPLQLAPLIITAALGSGLIMALCSGGALTPFSHNSGSASSLYLLLQSVGASALSLVIGLWLPKELTAIALAMAACGLMALISKLAIREIPIYKEET